MRILYATGRYSPLKHDEGSGEDFNLYNAFIRKDHEVKIVGPFPDQPSLIEKVYRRIHSLVSKKRYAKYSKALLRKTAAEVTREIQTFQPDVLFSHNLIPFTLLKTSVPIVYLTDSPLLGTETQWPLFSRIEFRRMLAWEKQVVRKSARIITRSRWAKELLVNDYGTPEEKIRLVQAASSLPAAVVPAQISTDFPTREALHLLLVGRVYRLKGVDIAIEIANRLHALGIGVELRIVGLTGESTEAVKFMGLYRKAVPEELEKYASQYAWAHFLLHPARYDSAPIVTTEAASFGVPTISDAVGGIATTVQDGVSGVVLPALSPAEEYVKVFQHYIQHPDEYLALRRSTRERYERELNWESVGNRVLQVMAEAAGLSSQDSKNQE